MRRARLFLLASTVAVLQWSASAQVFIPDLNERTLLNTEIPGIVDIDGIMDTLHPGIADVDTLAMMITGNAPTLDLQGIRYLDLLQNFSLSILQDTACAATCAGLPALLNSMSVRLSGGSLHLPALPQSLLYLDVMHEVWSPDMPEVMIDQLPDTMGGLTLTDVTSMSWEGTGRIGQFAINLSLTPFTDTFTLPSAEVGYMSIMYGGFNHLDLSALTVSNLDLNNVIMDGPITWPAQLDHLGLLNAGFYEPPSAFPSMLRGLMVLDTWPLCLPWLPDSLNELEMQGTATCLPNWPPALETAFLYTEFVTAGTVNYCSVLNTDCRGINPGIAGTAFMDLDADGQHDAGEPGPPQSSVLVQPGANVAGCGSDGYWMVGVAPGSYAITLATTYPYIASVSPAAHTADVPEMMDADTLNDFAVTLLPDIADLRVQLVADPARPGFGNRLYLSCQNYGTIPRDATLTLEFDALQTWVGSSVLPDMQSPSSATWDLPGLSVGATQTITVDLHTPVGTAINTAIAHTLTASPVLGDESPADNVVVLTARVVGSYDPNDKQLTPASLSPEQVQAGGMPITYTIRFQNTGTYPAERVLILDTLPAGLDVASIQFLGSSHACHWYVSEGTLHVLHEGINLPDSSSNEPESHGFIRFSILPETDLADGAEVVNIAHIVFDFNEPIITPPAVFQVDAIQGLAEQAEAGLVVRPNPASDRLWITVHGSARKPLRYSVQDLAGRRILSGQLSGNSAVDVSLLPAGLYMLAVEDGGRTRSVRFVKQ